MLAQDAFLLVFLPDMWCMEKEARRKVRRSQNLVFSPKADLVLVLSRQRQAVSFRSARTIIIETLAQKEKRKGKQMSLIIYLISLH